LRFHLAQILEVASRFDDVGSRIAIHLLG
jgi:hypothetical protein